MVMVGAGTGGGGGGGAPHPENVCKFSLTLLSYIYAR